MFRATNFGILIPVHVAELLLTTAVFSSGLAGIDAETNVAAVFDCAGCRRTQRKKFVDADAHSLHLIIWFARRGS
jgi:hypothetical protein